MGDKRKPLKKKKDSAVVAKPAPIEAKPAASAGPKKDAK